MNMYAKDIEPKCALCQMGEPIPDTLDVLCKKYGVVPYNHDIFKKKVRRRAPVDAGYSAEDFSID